MAVLGALDELERTFGVLRLVVPELEERRKTLPLLRDEAARELPVLRLGAEVARRKGELEPLLRETPLLREIPRLLLRVTLRPELREIPRLGARLIPDEEERPSELPPLEPRNEDFWASAGTVSSAKPSSNRLSVNQRSVLISGPPSCSASPQTEKGPSDDRSSAKGPLRLSS